MERAVVCPGFPGERARRNARPSRRLRSIATALLAVTGLAGPEAALSQARTPAHGGLISLTARARVATGTPATTWLRVSGAIGRRDRALVVVLRRDRRIVARHAFELHHGGRVSIRW